MSKDAQLSIEIPKGICVVCGERVLGSDQYIESVEGYCHKSCALRKRQTDSLTA